LEYIMISWGEAVYESVSWMEITLVGMEHKEVSWWEAVYESVSFWGMVYEIFSIVRRFSKTFYLVGGSYTGGGRNIYDVHRDLVKENSGKGLLGGDGQDTGGGGNIKDNHKEPWENSGGVGHVKDCHMRPDDSVQDNVQKPGGGDGQDPGVEEEQEPGWVPVRGDTSSLQDMPFR
jgi:hypothetical protein